MDIAKRAGHAYNDHALLMMMDIREYSPAHSLLLVSWLLGEEPLLQSQIRSKICVLSTPLVKRKYFRNVIDKQRLVLEQDSLLPDYIEKGFLFLYP